MIGRDWVVLVIAICVITCALSYLVIALRRDQRNRHKLEKLHGYLTSDRDEADHKDHKA